MLTHGKAMPMGTLDNLSEQGRKILFAAIVILMLIFFWFLFFKEDSNDSVAPSEGGTETSIVESNPNNSPEPITETEPSLTETGEQTVDTETASVPNLTVQPVPASQLSTAERITPSAAAIAAQNEISTLQNFFPIPTAQLSQVPTICELVAKVVESSTISEEQKKELLQGKIVDGLHNPATRLGVFSEEQVVNNITFSKLAFVGKNYIICEIQTPTTAMFLGLVDGGSNWIVSDYAGELTP